VEENAEHLKSSPVYVEKRQCMMLRQSIVVDSLAEAVDSRGTATSFLPIASTFVKQIHAADIDYTACANNSIGEDAGQSVLDGGTCYSVFLSGRAQKVLSGVLRARV
jgi:hypothetical protein